MKRIALLLAILTTISCKTGNSDIDVVKSESELEDMVSYLASDELQGRMTGSAGIDAAATYAEKYFSSNNVKPYFESYRDTFIIGDTLNAFNVVGYVEGMDKNLKDEVIIIGAHYDHIGYGYQARKRSRRGSITEKDSIANGANDNATGSAGVLTLAKYFGKNKSNKRSIMFVLFTAEEMGLLGSKHLAKRLKDEQLDLYAMVNFEMIGVPLIDQNYKAFLSGYDLSNMGEKMNEYSGDILLGFSEISKMNNLFKRSDNFPFYETFKLPCHTISSCDLRNFNYYHHSDDEISEINFDFMNDLINSTTAAVEVMANTKTREIRIYDN